MVVESDGHLSMRRERKSMLSPTAASSEVTARCLVPRAKATMGSAAEFFAGIGLVRAALESAHWTVMYANDISPMKREMYRNNFSDLNLDDRDIRLIRGHEVPQVDLATASFPCIDLSLAGNHAGLDGQHSGLLWEFLRVIDEMEDRRPSLLLIENVPSFVTSKGGADLRDAIATLNNLGYQCDLVVTDARWYLPQSRRRLFIICAPEFPDHSIAECFESDLRPSSVLRFIDRNKDLDLAPLRCPAPPTHHPELETIVEEFPPDAGLWWDSDRVARFVDSLSDRNQLRFDALKACNGFAWATAYRRTRNGKSAWEIRGDSVAGCLRTASGGSSKQAIIEANSGIARIRWMTPTEYARLQGAHDYRIPPTVTRNQALFGFGDAVCVPAVTWVLAHFINPLAENKPCDSVVDIQNLGTESDCE